MREYLNIGDLIVAEIKNPNLMNNTLNLHLRNEKFGKLSNGIVIAVNSCLIKKMKTHFIDFEEVLMIFGLNGFVWIQSRANEPSTETLEKIAKLRNIILVLNESGISLHPSNILDLYHNINNYRAKDLRSESNKTKLLEFLKNKILKKE